MADTTALTPAQITALAATPTDRPLAAPTPKVVVKDTALRFYFADDAGVTPGLARVTASNKSFSVDVLVKDVLTAAEQKALAAIFEKLHVAVVLP